MACASRTAAPWKSAGSTRGKRPRDVKQKIGAALQTTSLQDKITPREALELFGSFYHVKAAPRCAARAIRPGRQGRRAVRFAVGGQRQRLALALAFVNNPELVFLDEPTTGLDAQSRRELHGEIRRMKADGHTVLLTTHYMEEAESLCDRIAVIDRGRIVAAGSTTDLIAASSSAPSVSLTHVAAAGSAHAGSNSRRHRNPRSKGKRPLPRH